MGPHWLIDLAVGVVAGAVAAKATEFAQQALYWVMPQSIKDAEERVRPGPPYRIATEKTAEAVGVELTKKQRELGGAVMHYGSGVIWGPVYGLLRRYSAMNPLGAGVVTGATMSLVLDEAITPALGFTAPSRDYPTATHVRGFLNHLVFGLAVAATAEVIYRSTVTAPP